MLWGCSNVTLRSHYKLDQAQLKVSFSGSFRKEKKSDFNLFAFTENADYTPFLRTLTFDPSPAMIQEMCIDVSIVDDTSYEDVETFMVFLRVSDDVRSAVSINIEEATFAIVDDDQVTLSLASGNRTLAENSGTFEVCVELSGQTEVTIPYEISVESSEGEKLVEKNNKQNY